MKNPAIEKEHLRELAWKELIQALKPKTNSLFVSSQKRLNNSQPTSLKHAVSHHPAIITNTEFSHWEIFG